MKLARSTPTVLTLTLTGQELAVLFAAARFALDGLRSDTDAPREATAGLERIIHEYERALKRLDDDGRP